MDTVQHVDVVIVGGGLAGWTAAAVAARAGANVAVVDRDGTGGRAATDEVEGFRFNRGAHALYTAGPGMAVMRSLGIEPSGADPGANDARGVVEGRLELLPVDTGSMLRTRLLGSRSKARLATLLAGIDRRDPQSVAHLSIDEFLDDLDLREDARQVLAAVIRLGSYAADHARTSADVAVTQLQLGSKGVSYLHGGWRQLTGALGATAVRGGTRPVHHAATGLDHDGAGVEVTTSAGVIRATQVVLAVGNAAAAAALLGHTPPDWAALGPAAEASCLDVGLDTDVALPLTIGIDEPLYFNSHAVADLAPRGQSVAHVMRYLRADETWPADDGRTRLESHLWRSGVDPAAVVQARYLHRMTVTSALPIPERGGMTGRPTCTSTGSDRVLVAGDWVGPTGNLADAPITSGAAAGRLAATRALSVARR